MIFSFYFDILKSVSNIFDILTFVCLNELLKINGFYDFKNQYSTTFLSNLFYEILISQEKFYCTEVIIIFSRWRNLKRL